MLNPRTRRLLTAVAGAATLTLAGTATAFADPTPDPIPGTSAADYPARPANQAPVLLPPFNFNANILGFDFKHTNQFPAGVTFDGAVWAVNPDWTIITIGWLADMAPFIDANCASGSIVFETKTGELETHPLASACSNGYIYGLVSNLPAKNYRTVCMSSATIGDRGERACFRFIN
ncbi:hypothetical protein ACFVUS_33495 [Nocardia sp. NPDC058058]|uniref:hypothetical protein n=1 Tax=Nocardia sp. NPDC058058 TaxID=3346317 RepID=UPI0036D7B25F